MWMYECRFSWCEKVSLPSEFIKIQCIIKCANEEGVIIKIVFS